ncbi:MAG: N-acetylmuramoyl-L-alanine amidase [Salinisphaera sp.]|jgi:N-acetylmuramoyl-L-alanine amidase|nr:N-acetylmuramoyl-L-alanine amidase [Salinisphaera sp.]
MRNLLRGLCLAVMLMNVGAVWAAASTLHDARLWDSGEKTRIVFDLSADTNPDIFLVDNPLRLVVDLPHTRAVSSLDVDADHGGLVKQVRTGIHRGTGLRVVLDLSQMVAAKSFMLAPDGQHAYRLVVDLYRGQPDPQTHSASNEPSDGELAPGDDGATTADKTAAAMAQTSNAGAASSAAPARRSGPGHDIVVAIDAGHGGRDPGAHGPHGTLEKNVTLAIARRLKQMVDDQPHMRGVLTRSTDRYVGLRERMVIARRNKADFFISIHCDASPDGRAAQGASVYALSPHGATSEHARWLATRENAADMVSGGSIKDKNSSLASFMLDLSQSTSVEASLDAGHRVLEQLDDLGSLHKTHVQQAGFVVLKSPDIPSILVETNFISNPHEEHKLASSRYQNRLASAMLRGIKGYFASYRPATYIAADQQHEIKRGETLSGIALKYGVSVAALRQYNQLKSSQIQIGHTLRIPPPGAQQLAGL